MRRPESLTQLSKKCLKSSQPPSNICQIMNSVIFVRSIFLQLANISIPNHVARIFRHYWSHPCVQSWKKFDVGLCYRSPPSASVVRGQVKGQKIILKLCWLCSQVSGSLSVFCQNFIWKNIQSLKRRLWLKSTWDLKEMNWKITNNFSLRFSIFTGRCLVFFHFSSRLIGYPWEWGVQQLNLVPSLRDYIENFESKVKNFQAWYLQ